MIKAALIMGPKELAKRLCETSFETLASFLYTLAKEIPNKTHSAESSAQMDTAEQYLNIVADCITVIDGDYKTLLAQVEK